MTAAQIITAAMEDLQVISGGSTVSTADSATALQRLNFIVKQFQGNADMAQGLKVHSRQRVKLFLAKNQMSYTVGPAATDNNATTQYGRTTLTAGFAAGQTVLSIASNSDATTAPGTTYSMTNADNVGVVQSDGTLWWTTINANGANSVTLTGGLAVAALNGAYVYWYTAKAQRFPLCEIAELRNSDLIDTQLGMFTEVSDYERLPQKRGTGDPINVLVEPLRLSTRVILDMAPQDVTKQLHLTVLYPSENYDATSNDIAFPQEWFAALEWELAFRLAPAFGVDWTPGMQANHDAAMMMARQLNPANSSAYFQPNSDQRWPGNV